MYSLAIDTDRAIEEITKYLQEIVRRDHSRGVILGLSGGLDSCVLAALAVRALGPRAVSVIYIGDRDSDPTIADRAREVARLLGLTLETVDISDEMAERGVYAPLFVRLLRLSPVVAEISSTAYRLVNGEPPFVSALRVGGGEKLTPWYKRLMYDLTMRHVDEGFSQRHIRRRAIAERLARERNLSLIGAANLSECETGWFVKDGIDDLPVQPLSGLYKTQVRQLAEALGLPELVRTQLPSPDMARGVTDEFGIGHLYRDIDKVFDGHDRGLPEGEMAKTGVPPDEVRAILELRRLSAWKRTSPHEAPPISGRFGSPIRR